MTMKRHALLALLMSMTPALLAAQRGANTAVVYDSALHDWNRGDYVHALGRLSRVLQSPEKEQYLEPIALLTGELFAVRELTSDGRAPRWSERGSYASYETGNGRERATRILASQSGQAPKELAVVRGFGLVFSPSEDRVAYFALGDSPELARARADAERLAKENDRAAAARAQLELTRMEIIGARVMVRDLSSGAEHALNDVGLLKSTLAFSSDGRTVFLLGAKPEDEARTDIYALSDAAPPALLAAGEGVKAGLQVVRGGKFLVFDIGGRSPFPSAQAGAAGGRGGGRGGGAGGRSSSFGVLELQTGALRVVNGTSPSLSSDGGTLAYLGKDGAFNTLIVSTLGGTPQERVVVRTADSLAAPALSPSGKLVAFQMMPDHDWEIYVAPRDSGGAARRLTREIQHDLQPRFIDESRVFAVMGEARHRRSYLYDLDTGTRRRLFHNNTVRTIAPEYEWAVSPDATRILTVAERDGDTVSPERGVYLTDLTQRLTSADVLERVRTDLVAEQRLRAQGEREFAPVAPAVRAAVAEVSTDRVYSYEKALFDFDSKYITQPGNAKARQFLFDTYKSFGYSPAFQEFEASAGRGGGQPVRTANVVATLPGTVNPELVYVVSSHFDSRFEGPGADDNSSGTSALLEVARVLAKRPLPATIVFASFTGEEAGLLGSREFVRQATAKGMKVVGALNNDMVGWANDNRLDNTIRYSNPGIRDVQHAAAFLFTNLITYDALYYKSTDAAAFYEAWGDIVGGIGSYPVLGNPHYHMPHDNLEVINHQLVAEVAKTTAATLMLLASSPSRLTGLTVASFDGSAAELKWDASPEKGVRQYVVQYGPPQRPEAQSVTVNAPRVRLSGIKAGTVVAVRAVNEKGLVGWDWARTVIGEAKVADR